MKTQASGRSWDDGGRAFLQMDGPLARGFVRGGAQALRTDLKVRPYGQRADGRRLMLADYVFEEDVYEVGV